MGTRRHLAEVAREKALLPFHGTIGDEGTNLKPIIDLFPKWNLQGAEGCWCAAFVYYCCMEAGFSFPYSPDACQSCSLAGCGGWEEFAMGDESIKYLRKDDRPEVGDIVLFDSVFCNREHDHIGIIVGVSDQSILCAEGNIGGTNRSGLIQRPIDGHVRAYIRIPDGYSYARLPGDVLK